MKLYEIKSLKTAKELLKIAKAVGEKLYGSSHTGLVFDDEGFNIVSAKEMLDNSDFDVVDTYDYVFFPSTGEGLDAADDKKIMDPSTDDKKIMDPSIRDKDGLLYLGGADGVKVVYFDEKPTFTQLPVQQSVSKETAPPRQKRSGIKNVSSKGRYRA